PEAPSAVSPAHARTASGDDPLWAWVRRQFAPVEGNAPNGAVRSLAITLLRRGTRRVAGTGFPRPAFLRQPSERSCTMKKFFALFAIPTAVVENWKKTTDPAKAKAMSDDMMKAWDKWMKDHEKDIVDKGPLGKTKRVTAQKVS